MMKMKKKNLTRRALASGLLVAVSGVVDSPLFLCWMLLADYVRGVLVTEVPPYWLLSLSTLALTGWDAS